MKDLNNNYSLPDNSAARRLPQLSGEDSTFSRMGSVSRLAGRTPGPRLTKSQIVSFLEVAIGIVDKSIIDKKNDGKNDDEVSQGSSDSSPSGNCSGDELE
jgi:hypothetical protein